jgi:hypothetical protein
MKVVGHDICSFKCVCGTQKRQSAPEVLSAGIHKGLSVSKRRLTITAHSFTAAANKELQHNNVSHFTQGTPQLHHGQPIYAMHSIA